MKNDSRVQFGAALLGKSARKCQEKRKKFSKKDIKIPLRKTLIDQKNSLDKYFFKQENKEISKSIK